MLDVYKAPRGNKRTIAAFISFLEQENIAYKNIAGAAETEIFLSEPTSEFMSDPKILEFYENCVALFEDVVEAGFKFSSYFFYYAKDLEYFICDSKDTSEFFNKLVKTTKYISSNYEFMVYEDHDYINLTLETTSDYFTAHTNKFSAVAWIVFIKHLYSLFSPLNKSGIKINLNEDFSSTECEDLQKLTEIPASLSCVSRMVFPKTVNKLKLAYDLTHDKEFLNEDIIFNKMEGGSGSRNKNIEVAVREILVNKICSKKETAGQLGLSERTLNNRLSELNTSYGEILNKVRMHKLQILLKDKTVGLKKMSLELGFLNQASFGRFFRKNFNSAPSEYLRKNR